MNDVNEEMTELSKNNIVQVSISIAIGLIVLYLVCMW